MVLGPQGPGRVGRRQAGVDYYTLQQPRGWLRFTLHLENWITKEELLKYPLAGISNTREG